VSQMRENQGGFGVADEGKMVSQMRENQGGFGVTDEGDLVSQMRGLPVWVIAIRG